jgi:hypothetical protein
MPAQRTKAPLGITSAGINRAWLTKGVADGPLGRAPLPPPGFRRGSMEPIDPQAIPKVADGTAGQVVSGKRAAHAGRSGPWSDLLLSRTECAWMKRLSVEAQPFLPALARADRNGCPTCLYVSAYFRVGAEQVSNLSYLSQLDPFSASVAVPNGLVHT